MSQNLRILLTASLNEGLSIREINKKIKELSKHKSLQAIKIKLDVDSKILQTLQNFNKNINQINRANVEHSKSTNQATAAIQQETNAINQQNKALEKNGKIREKITTFPSGVVQTDTTSGTKYDSTTSSKFNDLKGNLIDKPSPEIRNVNHTGELAFYDAQLKKISQLKLALNSLSDNKSADFLAQKYDKITQKLRQLQSTGESLTQQDIKGITTRIQRLDSYSRSLSQIENKQKQAAAQIASAEKAIAKFSGRHGTEKAKDLNLNNLLAQMKQIDPASRGAIASLKSMGNEISKITAGNHAASKSVMNFGEALKTAMVKMPVDIYAGVKLL